MANSLQICQIGKIKQIRRDIALAIGLSNVFVGEVLSITKNVKGLVIGFVKEDTYILLLGELSDVFVGMPVYSKGEIFTIPIGDSFIGRIINTLGQTLDNKGIIKDSDIKGFYPIFKDAPAILEREPISQALNTGILAIDSVIPIGKGQRQLIIGDRMTGKTTIAIDSIINQKNKNIICIYCFIGRSESLLERIIDILNKHNALDYTIVVAASAANSCGEQYISPYIAATLGEYFMYRGKDVFVVFDDLTRHAWSYRQISLLLEHFPGRDAYPGDIFYIHSQLMERAAKLSKELGAGSMTFFPIVDTLQGDFTGYLQSNLISMTDGQIYLNSNLFNEGIKPAIDLGLSVSRIGNRVQCFLLKELSTKLRLESTQYYELVKTTRFKTEMSKEAESILKRGEIIKQLFKQDREETYSLEKQILLLYALKNNMLDNFSNEEVIMVKNNIEDFFQKHFPELLKSLAIIENINEEFVDRLNNALKRCLQELKL